MIETGKVVKGMLVIATTLPLLACQTGSPDSTATAPPNDTYIGWYCKGEKKTDSWICSQRRLRNGEPVDDVVYAVKRSSDTTAKASGQSSGTTAAPEGSWEDWKNKLPTLDDTLVAGAAANSEKAREGTETEKSEQRPQPVPAFDSWANDNATDSQSATDNTATNQAAATEPSFSARVQPGSGDELSGSFTIQLGAFSSKAKRDDFIDQKGLNNLPLKSFKITSRGRNWWILTYGDYKTRDEAIIAWASVSKKYPPLEIWVRSSESLKKAIPTTGKINP